MIHAPVTSTYVRIIRKIKDPIWRQINDTGQESDLLQAGEQY